MSITALNTYLEPLKHLLDREGVSELSINEPGFVWVEEHGSMVREDVPSLTYEHLMALGRLIAQSTSQEIGEEKPLLSATLPGGYRVQVMFPPAVERGHVAMSIRKQFILNLDLEAYEGLGSFSHTVVGEHVDEDTPKLSSLLNEGRIREFLEQAVLLKRTLLFPVEPRLVKPRS